jgi:SPP1 family predicted phage head-tail adaptor
MSAGIRRNYITIKRKAITSYDSHGQPVYTWATVANAWANIVPMSGREMQAVSQLWAEARFRFDIEPFIDGVQRDMIIVWGARTLNILDVEDPTGRRKGLRGYAKELTE